MKVVWHDGKNNQSPTNCRPVIMYEGSDTYQELVARGENLRRQLQHLEENGMNLSDGRHVDIMVMLGGDLAFLSAEMGLAGSSATNPCVWCLVTLQHLNSMDLLSSPEVLAKRREVKASCMATHDVLEGFLEPGYECPAEGCGAHVHSAGVHGPSIGRSGKVEDRARQAWQRLHNSQKYMCIPWLYFLEWSRRVPDILHITLRLVEAVFDATVMKEITTPRQACIILT